MIFQQNTVHLRTANNLKKNLNYVKLLFTTNLSIKVKKKYRKSLIENELTIPKSLNTFSTKAIK